MNHYRLIQGIKSDERLIQKIDNCKGGHCVTWYGSHSGHGTVVFRCVRCKKVFILVQKDSSLEREMKNKQK